jgi:hypothetical protein
MARNVDSFFEEVAFKLGNCDTGYHSCLKNNPTILVIIMIAEVLRDIKITDDNRII